MEEIMHIISSRRPVIPRYSSFKSERLTACETEMVERWGDPPALYNALDTLILEAAVQQRMSQEQRQQFAQKMRQGFEDMRTRRYSPYLTLMELRMIPTREVSRES